MYTTLKVIHVIAAIIWIGAGTAFSIMNARISSRKDEEAARVLGAEGEFFGKGVFMPASIVTLLAGVGMVLASDGAIGFGEPWIGIGFAGIIISTLIGAVLITRATDSLNDAAKAGDTATVTAMQQRLGVLGATDLVVLYIVVWAMVVRPGG